ncbi:MAG: glycosyltransferase, partial [Anaerolineaceae bacterium]|nr:glycosyltransferase [Anaerolineaceae bacterium]
MGHYYFSAGCIGGIPHCNEKRVYLSEGKSCMKKTTRVLQVMYEMGVGGIETWLMNILRSIDRDRIRIDFAVYTNEPRYHDAEIRSLGSRIIPCTHPSQVLKHERDLRRILTQEGHYDVVHANGTQSTGRTLKIAAEMKIPIRIAHSHNDFRMQKRSLRSRLLLPVTKYWLNKYMTAGLAVSEEASIAIFGNHWKKDPRCKILNYGIDWAKYQHPLLKRNILNELGLPADRLVIGHVGRFVPQKNHEFLVDIAQALLNIRKNVLFLLVGDGVLRASVEGKVKKLGLEPYFVFLGERSDIANLLQAMDVFLFPSLFEGLPIALLEAQVVGLPCV